MITYFTQKKNVRIVLLGGSIGLLSLTTYAQDKAKLQVKKGTNSRKLSSLKSELKKKSEAARKRVDAYKKIHGNSELLSLKDGVRRELMDVGEDGTLYYYTTDNDGVAKTTRTDKLHPSSGLGYNLTGEGEMIGIWDAGVVRQYHEVFTGRAYSKEGRYNNNDTDEHATHVGGTMVGLCMQLAEKPVEWHPMLLF